MKKIFVITGIAIAMLTMDMGCTSFMSNAQHTAEAKRRSYLLEVKLPTEPCSTQAFSAVKIQNFSALPPCDARMLVVRRANGEVALDFYTLWLVAPQDMVRIQTAKYMEACGIAKSVYDTETRTYVRYSVEGVLSELYLDCREASKQTAVVSLKLFVVDESKASFDRVGASEATERVEVVKGDIPAAFNKALTGVLAKLMTDLNKHEISQ